MLALSSHQLAGIRSAKSDPCSVQRNLSCLPWNSVTSRRLVSQPPELPCQAAGSSSKFGSTVGPFTQLSAELSFQVAPPLSEYSRVAVPVRTPKMMNTL